MLLHDQTWLMPWRGEEREKKRDKTWPRNNRARQKEKQLRKSVPGKHWARSSSPDEYSEGVKEWLSKHFESLFFFRKADWNVANGRVKMARESAGYLRVIQPFFNGYLQIFGPPRYSITKSICQHLEWCRLSRAPSNLSIPSHHPHGWLGLPIPWRARWLEVNAAFPSCYWLHVSPHSFNSLPWGTTGWTVDCSVNMEDSSIYPLVVNNRPANMLAKRPVTSSLSFETRISASYCGLGPPPSTSYKY